MTIEINSEVKYHCLIFQLKLGSSFMSSYGTLLLFVCKDINLLIEKFKGLFDYCSCNALLPLFTVQSFNLLWPLYLALILSNHFLDEGNV